MPSCCVDSCLNPNASEFGKCFKPENNSGCCGSCGEETCNPKKGLWGAYDEALNAEYIADNGYLLLAKKRVKEVKRISDTSTLVRTKHSRRDFILLRQKTPTFLKCACLASEASVKDRHTL